MTNRSPLSPVIQALRLTLVCCLAFGAAYPLVILGAAKVMAPAKAEGSLIRDQAGQVIGSERIAQAFSKPEWFWPRPSAVGYDASATGGSNLAPTNPALAERIQETIASHRAAGDDVSANHPLPIDLAFASGGGLDPDITIDAAGFQAPRVARSRGLPIDRVKALVDSNVEGALVHRFTGASPTINVLALNLALAELAAESSSK
jgi:K+-transporting ATPase ATPase C chain